MILKRENQIFLFCALFALLVEGMAIYLSGMRISFNFSHSTPANAPVTEMEVITLPEEEAPHLKSESESVPHAEDALSRNSSQKNSQKVLSESTQNETVKGHPLSPTHGPVIIESPAPVIPEYLKNRDLNTKVVIEFTVLSTGAVTPKLLVSSGNEELDQIALSSARKWKFYPAESNHQAIDSKVRLRILFEVK